MVYCSFGKRKKSVEESLGGREECGAQTFDASIGGRRVMVNRNNYLKNPCRESSIPYWKAKHITVPEGMKILHQDDFNAAECTQFTDALYFRLRHDLKGLLTPRLPQRYSLCEATVGDFVRHINQCYDDICISEAELQGYTARSVYNASLWLAVRDNETSDIAATGIAELDRECGEGILEWIQVSENCRGHGLGSYIVAELLWRMKDMARFVTVSGQCNNPTNPEGLYRKCGFIGNDVWHILRKRT